MAMTSEAELLDAIAIVFPITGERHSLELAEQPAAWTEDGLYATVRLVVRDPDGTIRDIKEQQLVLLPAKHCSERGIAYLEACAAFATAASSDDVEVLMPADFFSAALLDSELPPEAFVRVLADPRARMILERRPDDLELRATLDPATRPAPPVLRDEALEQRILDNLDAGVDEPGAYAVYGDWLSERGDPRGELIALQIAAAGTYEPALEQRIDHLKHEYAYEWLGELAWSVPGQVALEWKCGFVERVTFGPPESYEHAARDSSAELMTLVELPVMPFVRDVELRPKELWSDDLFEALGRVGLPAATRRLALATGEYGHMRDIEPGYRAMQRLHELRLQSRSFELGTVELPALRSLELVTRGLTKANLLALRAAKWPQLEKLVLWLGDEDVDDCDVELTDLEWILEGDGVPALKYLGLCGRSSESSPLVRRLLDAPILPRLAAIDLSGAYLENDVYLWLQWEYEKIAHLAEVHLPTSMWASTVTRIGPNCIVSDRFIPVYE